MFSRRVRDGGSPGLFHRAQDRARASGRALLDLTESNPTRVGLPYDNRSIREALADPRALVYEPDPRGLHGARTAVAAWYASRGAAVDPGSLLLTTGTSEAYAHLFKLLAEPGQEVLVPKPGYPLLEVLTALEGVRLVHYPSVLDARGVWAVDLERLENTVSTNTVAIVVVSPNNPTGAFLKRAELDRLTTVARRFGLALIVDEVFGDYGVGENADRVLTAAGQAGVLTFVLNGLSKTALLPQLKLGWIQVSGPVAERTEALRRLEFISDAFLSVSAGVQHGAAALLQGCGAVQEALRRRLAANERALRAALAPLGGVRCPAREAGWYALVDCSGLVGGGGDDELAALLVEEDGVVCHPGFYYDFREEGWLVLSLLPRPEVFEAGVERLAARLAALQGIIDHGGGRTDTHEE